MSQNLLTSDSECVDKGESIVSASPLAADKMTEMQLQPFLTGET